MQKEFDVWNEKKKAIHKNAAYVFFHPRELWFAHLGINVGFEQDGRGDGFLRPILIVRKFNNEVLWALPLTRTSKPDSPYYADFEYAGFPEVSDAPLFRLSPYYRNFVSWTENASPIRSEPGTKGSSKK